MIHQIVNPYRVPTQNNEIQASFPVSSGAHHRAKEVAIGAPPNAPVFEEQSKVSYLFFSIHIGNYINKLPIDKLLYNTTKMIPGGCRIL